MSLEPLFVRELDMLNTVEMPVDEYLKASLESEKDESKYCKGWKYLGENIPSFLRELLKQDSYWECKYNEKTMDFIEERVGKLTPEMRKQLGAFVYVYNDKRRDAEDRARRQAIIDRGFEEITGDRQDLDKVKVSGIFEISKIGIMGSFDALEEKEGTLTWCERLKCLMLIPKRSRTRGHPIRDKAYIRRV